MIAIAIAAMKPSSADQLLQVSGVGQAKLEAYGDQVLETVSGT